VYRQSPRLSDLLPAAMFNPQNIMDSFLALCEIDQDRALTPTFHFYVPGIQNIPDTLSHDGAKDKDNTNKQCF
jgi:hypothetical protein